MISATLGFVKQLVSAQAAEEEAEMRPTDNGNKVRRARRPNGIPRTDRLFSLTNKEIMADLMYGRGSQGDRRISR